MKTKDSALSESEELLILKLVDGECSALDRFRARRLLASKAAAVQFKVESEALSERLRVREDPPPDVDLWMRVASRIAEEERAEVLLGRRTTDREDRAERFFGRFAWGMSGALVTASLAFLVWQPFKGGSALSTSPSANAGGGAEGEGAIRAVSLVSDGRSGPEAPPASGKKFGRPQIIDRAVQGALEVDWMRSAGRVKVVQNPEERSAIIWVNPSRSKDFSRNEGRKMVVVGESSLSGEQSSGASEDGISMSERTDE